MTLVETYLRAKQTRREYRKKNKDKLKAYMDKWWKENDHKRKEYRRRIKAKHGKRIIEQSWFNRNKHDPLFMEEYLKRQNEYRKTRRAKKIRSAPWPKPDRCEICDKHTGKLVWDHDHRTGYFRGWICSACNSALGFARDDIEVLNKMVMYLKRAFINEEYLWKSNSPTKERLPSGVFLNPTHFFELSSVPSDQEKAPPA